MTNEFQSRKRGWHSARFRSRASFGMIALVICLARASTCLGQEKPKNKPLFLVARTSILDPYFEHSVVLMVPLPDTSIVVGMIVNKPAPPPLVKILQQSPLFKSRTDIAYFGGPVDMTDLAVAFHTAKPPKTAIPLYDDVYLTFDGDFIMKLLRDPKQSGEMRLFLGRSQWAPEQLQGEA